MGRSTVHYADNKTNNALKKLHNKLRPAGTPVQRVEYIIELLLIRIFETKIKQDDDFKPLRKLFSIDYKWLNPKTGKEESNENRLFSYLPTVANDQILSELNENFFPFYSNILQSARKVFEGNLPQKVQDQLVLIEEVFSNSNFTNNVNSGNLGEVIGIIANDIEESRLLQTDLLGDAIESALSETGGTKDIGLFRTPNHIRQFMTALVEPTFDDVIFDPACGTGGFLFEAFEFVMRRVDPARNWPGEKAHSELSAWFDDYFAQNRIDFPSIEQTTQFYRNGVAGIEYLGMIRKMAAINFYITQEPIMTEIKAKAQEPDYQPTQEEIDQFINWLAQPNTFMDEGHLQKMYDYPEGSAWDFLLHALGKKKIPTPKERIEKNYLSYIHTYNFTDEQILILKKIKDVFVSNVASKRTIDEKDIFGNPIYEKLIGSYESINQKFNGNFSAVIKDLKDTFTNRAVA